MEYVYDDGGPIDNGFKALAGDCVCRAIVIASGRPYKEVYERLAEGNKTQRKGKHEKAKHGKRTAQHGINVRRKWFKDYMTELGFVWVPTMGIGTGCKVHLRESELPAGRLIVSVSKHYTAVIDGVIRDTHDPQRIPLDHADSDKGELDGTRCVYGYWRQQ